MHVMMIGPQGEALRYLVSSGHSVTVLYEPQHESRLPIDLAGQFTSLPVLSYTDLTELWGTVTQSRVPIDHVVTTRESAVLEAALLSSLVGSHTVVPEVVLGCRDKRVQKSCWLANSVRTPRSFCPQRGVKTYREAELLIAESGLITPLILKPVSGGGSRDVTKIETALDLLTALSRSGLQGQVILEEYIEGPEWHIDGVVVDGVLGDFIVSRYRTPLIETKHGDPAASVTMTESCNVALYERFRLFTSSVVHSLTLRDTVFHLEAFDTERGLIASELGCRPGGGMITDIFRITFGYDLNVAAVKLAIGDRAFPPTMRSKDIDYFGFLIVPTVAHATNRINETMLLKLNRVKAVRMRVSPGEVMKPMSTASSVGIAHVLFSAPSYAACSEAIEKVIHHVRAIHESV